jgi:hypothetical protein
MTYKDGVESDCELHQVSNHKGRTGLVRSTWSPQGPSGELTQFFECLAQGIHELVGV